MPSSAARASFAVHRLAILAAAASGRKLHCVGSAFKPSSTAIDGDDANPVLAGQRHAGGLICEATATAFSSWAMAQLQGRILQVNHSDLAVTRSPLNSGE